MRVFFYGSSEGAYIFETKPDRLIVQDNTAKLTVMPGHGATTKLKIEPRIFLSRLR